MSSRPAITNVLRESGAALHETRKRATMRLLVAMLKWTGATLLLVSCAMLVYLGAMLLARLLAGTLSP